MRPQSNHLARQHGDVITQMISKYGPLPVKQVIKGCQMSGFTPATTRRRINTLVDEGQLSLKVDSYAMIYVHLAGGEQS